METFRSRLFDERMQLHTRIEKLKSFILSKEFYQLDEIDKNDLVEQLAHMQAYFTVVDRRAGRLCNDA